jgi:hypothetical protein
MNQIGNLVHFTIFFFKLYAAHYSGRSPLSQISPRDRLLPEHFLTIFADPSDMDYPLTDEDVFSRAMVLCIGSLLATKVVEAFATGWSVQRPV